MNSNSQEEQKDESIYQSVDATFDQSKATSNDQELEAVFNQESSFIPTNSTKPEQQVGIEIFNGISSSFNQSINPIVTSKDPVQLFIYNLHSSTTYQQIKFHFSVVGTVLSIFIPVQREENRGFAFVTMQNKEDALKTEKILNDSQLNKSKIRITIMNKYLDLLQTKENKSLTIEQVLKSDELTEVQKCEKLNEIKTQLENMDNYLFLLLIDIESFELIKSVLNDFSSPLEVALLNILEFVSECILKLPLIRDISTNNYKTILFDEIQKSGLFDKIKRILYQRINKEDCKEYSFSTQLSQLFRIYLLIRKGQIISNQIFDLCLKVLKKNITQFNEIFQNIRINQEKQQKNDKQIELQENNQASILQTLLLTLNNSSEKNISNINFTEQINKFKKIYYMGNHYYVYQSVYKLYIMVDPTYILKDNCDFPLIIFQESLNNQFNTYIFNEHFSLNNFAQIIISSTISLQSKQQFLHQPRLSSLSLLNSTLNFFFLILSQDEYVICNLIASIPNFIQSIISLHNFKYNNYNIQNQERNIYNNIRIKCREFMNIIYANCNEETTFQMSQQGYLNTLTLWISNAGGISEDNNNEIYKLLLNIKRFLQFLYNGYKYQLSINQTQQQPINHNEVKSNIERIEEIGSLEEIEAQLTNNGQYGNIKNEVRIIKNIISNQFINL